MTASSFTFKEKEGKIEVYYRGRCLGTIVGMLEASGRPCYRLGMDTRKKPRTYRGRQRAAEVLRIIDSLKRQAAHCGWSVEELIIHAWDAKPPTAASSR